MAKDILQRNIGRQRAKRAGQVMKMRASLNKLVKAGATREQRLAFLIHWAAVKAPRVEGETYEQRRAAIIRSPRVRVGQCWACNGWADLTDHHIIQIQNGGYSWDRNLIRICGECHVAVHPWLDMPRERTQYA